MDLSLIASSGLLGLFFLKHHSRLFGAVFLLNVGVFAFILVTSGVRFTRILLFAADIYWLNLYLVGIAKFFHILSSPRALVTVGGTSAEPAAPADRGGSQCLCGSTSHRTRQIGTWQTRSTSPRVRGRITDVECNV
jgi:hypothetical protein